VYKDIILKHVINTMECLVKSYYQHKIIIENEETNETVNHRHV